jgi:type III secretion protein N (ATPase)
LSPGWPEAALAAARAAPLVRPRGRITAAAGWSLRAALANVRQGELVHVARGGAPALPAEVVGFRAGEALLMPLDEPRGIEVDGPVISTGAGLSVRVGPGLLGRVLDGLGRPVDGRAPPAGLVPWEVERAAPAPLGRRRASAALPLGVRALDGLCTVAEGQRLGLFAGPGVGKSTLLAQIARQTSAERCVLALVGERGREVREFLEDALGPGGLARCAVVVATSDAPPLVRLRAAHVATAIAEYFAEVEGRQVLLLLDSLTRFARAQREVGLSAGEPPARQGYPPSVFAALPRLLERAGARERGSITGVYTVLAPGGDLDDPVADEVRGLLDGHVILDRRVAERQRWPAFDALASLSRLMPAVTTSAHRRAAARFRQVLAAYEGQRDLLLLGAYRRGSDPATDEGIDRIGDIEAFLAQRPDEPAPFDETVARLEALFP